MAVNNYVHIPSHFYRKHLYVRKLKENVNFFNPCDVAIVISGIEMNTINGMVSVFQESKMTNSYDNILMYYTHWIVNNTQINSCILRDLRN